MLIGIIKLSILTLIIYTIPLNIFSEVKNSNYDENDLIYEIIETHLISYIDWTAK
jgi:hypothetical protein